MNSRDAASIRSLLAEYNQICAAGDAAAYASLFTEDAVLMPPNTPDVAGRSAVETWAEALFGTMKVQVDTEDAEIEFADGWAFVRGGYSATFTPKSGGAPVEDTGNWFDIVRRQPDGSWQFARTMWASNRPLPGTN